MIAIKFRELKNSKSKYSLKIYIVVDKIKKWHILIKMSKKDQKIAFNEKFLENKDFLVRIFIA